MIDRRMPGPGSTTGRPSNNKRRTAGRLYCFLVLLLLLLLYSGAEDAQAARCYSDYCRNTTLFQPRPLERCLLEGSQRGSECVERKFENLGHLPPTGEPLAQVSLRAYVHNFGGFDGKATAFNFSINHINFNRLITRYQSLGDEDSSVCRRVEFYKNLTDSPLVEFHVSCPFSNDSYENTPYRLEYLITAESFEYSRKLVFHVPNHRYIDDAVSDISLHPPFLYVDVSDAYTLVLYVQPLAAKFNASGYAVWMMNNDTASARRVTLADDSPPGAAAARHVLNYSFPAEENGVVYFKVAALHPRCRSYGCVNATSPFININHHSSRLLIMIISSCWIPPVILFAAYYAYKFAKRKEMLESDERRPRCLLVYTPSHLAHVNVMIDLARYLRCCNINAMIDAIDIPETDSKDPVIWCNEAFAAADVVLVATSPDRDDVAAVVYRDMDTQALRLIKENYPRRVGGCGGGGKRYYALQLPYCRAEDVPREARHFRRFVLPDELDKLVRALHGDEYVRFFGVSDKEFVESVVLARMQIDCATPRSSRTTEENVDLLTTDSRDRNSVCSDIIQLHQVETEADDLSKNKTASKNFRTNIEELNLLGENGEVEVETFSTNQRSHSPEFRIDTLNL